MNTPVSNSIKGPSNAKFGLFFGFVFLGVGLYLFLAGSLGFAVLVVGVAALFFGFAIFKPSHLSKLNQSWMRLGQFLGRLINPVIMGILYWGIFVPLGLMMRLFGRDELRLFVEGEQTYWKVRKTANPEYDSFEYQF